MRLKAGSGLCDTVEHLMERPPAEPSARPKVLYHDFLPCALPG